MPTNTPASAESAKSTSKTSSRNCRNQTTKKKAVPSNLQTRKSTLPLSNVGDNKMNSVSERGERPISGSSAVESCLGDLDSDSDELILPAVSEAIRMLDLDSQGSSADQQAINHTGSSATSLFSSTLPKLPLVFGSNGFLTQSTWPAIGYCSSLLQQFVAKSQLGEPPPPPPMPQLPTKGARKCFPPLDEVPPSAASGDSAVKHAIDCSRQQAVVPANPADGEIDLVVPMRGLDCHPSHVSPDSGIQSVSGSPFSAHSSPLHPSTVACPGNQTSVIVATCPQVRSPSPSGSSQKKGRKPGHSKSITDLRASTNGCPDTLFSKEVDNAKASHLKSARRPRSCRDTASALSSGLGKDSSIVQAIQRGMNAALRLTGTNNDIACPKESNQLPLTECPRKPLETSIGIRSEGKSKDESKSVRTNSKSESHHKTSVKPDLPESSEIKPTTQYEPDRPASNEAVTLMAKSREEKRKKKKKKKHKSESFDNADNSEDPSLKPLVDQLCTRLDHCLISRSSFTSVSGRKRPFIFDRRKYAIGSMASLGGGRSKRRKVEEEAAQTNRLNARRRGKSKKSPAHQTAPLIKNPSVENEPTVAAAAAAVVLTAMDLLLPLKKRHHHLPAAETAVSGTENPPNCDSASEKPSHDLNAKDEANQPSQLLTNTRKRTANDETAVNPVEPAVHDVKTLTSAPEPAKRGRGRKKAKLETVDEEPAKSAQRINEEKSEVEEALEPVRDQVVQHNEHPTRKRNRRRKAINRTGFPSVKKKRKKAQSPMPEVAKPAVPDESKDEEPLPKQARKVKEISRNNSEEGSLPDPTYSETPSSDELSQPPAANEENSRPKKRRGLASLRKRYLPAGLLSNYFKEASDPSATSTAAPATGDRSKGLVYDPEEHEYGLLPPPFYCEKYLRRTRKDFQLPYDIWLLRQQGKLPDRDSLVPSWNYRKIRTNVYYDVKPPYSNDAQACNCTLPPPDAKGKFVLNYPFTGVTVVSSTLDPESNCCGEDCLNRMVYTECSNQLCPVGDKCTNQQIQRHRWAQGLERFMTKDKGWGVRCRNTLKAGQFILEYVGEVVSDKEFKERMHTIYVHDTHHYCLHLDGGLVIDGHRMGGDGEQNFFKVSRRLSHKVLLFQVVS